MFIILFISIVFSEKCWIVNKFQISCGDVYEDYAYVDWNFSPKNSRIFEAIDNLCPEFCNLKEETSFQFPLSTEKIYMISYENEKIKIFNTKTNEILLKTPADFNCLSCFLGLYKN